MNLERKRLAQSVDESPASYAQIAWALTVISPEMMFYHQKTRHIAAS